MESHVSAHFKGEDAQSRKPKKQSAAELREAGAFDAFLTSGGLPHDWTKPSWWIPVGCALMVHAVTFSVIWVIAMLLADLWWAAIGIAIVGAVIVAPFFRGLESLVHGAAHYDILGFKRAAANDFLGNLVAAFPVFQTVEEFRPRHLELHHGGFNGEDDPCKQRLRAHPNTGRGALPTFWTTLQTVPSETIAFYRVVGSNPRTLIKGMAWHIIFYVLPLSAIAGSIAVASVAWGLLVAPLFTITLPIVRCLAETGEHDYRDLPAEEAEQ